MIHSLDKYLLSIPHELTLLDTVVNTADGGPCLGGGLSVLEGEK